MRELECLVWNDSSNTTEIQLEKWEESHDWGDAEQVNVQLIEIQKLVS